MKALCIFAHPDDEVLFGWPVLQDRSNERAVLVISDNAQGYGDRSVKSFYELGRQEGWQTWCLGMASEFYRLPFRRAQIILPNVIRQVRSHIMEKIDGFKPDVIFTHNPIGEYGHGDHRLTFELVCTTPDISRVLFTDICIKNGCHGDYDKIPDYLWGCTEFFQNLRNEAKMDLEFFERCRAVYQNNQAWSWHGDVAVQCGVYEILI